jgi:hypothetical protein
MRLCIAGKRERRHNGAEGCLVFVQPALRWQVHLDRAACALLGRVSKGFRRKGSGELKFPEHVWFLP